MLPQPINSSECHALHVMYVLFVYAVGFLFRAAEANMLNNFYLSNSAKLKRQLTTMKASRLTDLCVFGHLAGLGSVDSPSSCLDSKERKNAGDGTDVQNHLHGREED